MDFGHATGHRHRHGGSRFHGHGAKRAGKCRITRGRNGQLKRVCGRKRRSSRSR